MKICLLYIYVTNHENTTAHAFRFASSYHEFPPGVEHDTIICCNGGPPSADHSLFFDGLKPNFWPRNNGAGYDIAAYIEAARTIAHDYDALLCLGESIHFWREGWLKRLIEARERYGDGMYGPFATHVLRAHLQTTAFLVSPKSLREYPLIVKDKASRYEFEHGERALWRRLHRKNQPVKLVTWDGEWNPGAWRLPKNGVWKGDQSNCLMWSNHTDRYFEANENRKRNWQISADRKFK